MKIAVVSSNGKVGRLVVAEAFRRGFDVTGFARSENKSDATKFVQKDIMDITKEDLAGFDAVVDAFVRCRSQYGYSFIGCRWCRQLVRR